MKIKLLFVIALLMICNCVYAESRIDYNHSEIYNQKDMDLAIEIIKEKFNSWQCTIRSIRYAGDDYSNSEENLKWMNDLSEGRNMNIKFDECIVFFSDFHSPNADENKTTFNPDSEYQNWTWYLARSQKGNWHLMSFGY